MNDKLEHSYTTSHYHNNTREMLHHLWGEPEWVADIIAKMPTRFYPYLQSEIIVVKVNQYTQKANQQFTSVCMIAGAFYVRYLFLYVYLLYLLFWIYMWWNCCRCLWLFSMSALLSRFYGITKTLATFCAVVTSSKCTANDQCRISVVSMASVDLAYYYHYN